MDIPGFFEKQSKPILVTIGLLTTVLVGIGDYFASSQLLEFSVFFLLPIAFFTWFFGRKGGIAACLLSGAIVLGANLSSSMHWRVACLNAVVWTVFFSS